MADIRQMAPEWFYERFYEETVKPNLDKEDSFVIDWSITKQTMIATLNYLRSKYKLKCEWMEKREDCYLIKISKP